MIFKRSQRSEILTPKRCNAAGGGGEDEGDGSERRPKRRRGDEFFPVELLGHVPVSVIPYAAFGFRWCDGPEASSPAAAAALTPAAAARPPVVRTSRGRAQVLPKRFNDSVLIDPWKKEKPAKPPVPIKAELPLPKRVVLCGGGAVVDKSFTLSEVYEDDDEEEDVDEEEAECRLACRNFGALRKYSISQSTLTSINDDPCSYYHRKEMMKRQYQEAEEEFFHWSGEFVYGDIVWAKLGKRQPVWPGMVVDPTQQATADAMPPQPHSDAVFCVMLFGWCMEFDDEKKYIWVRQGGIFPFVDYLDRGR